MLFQCLSWHEQNSLWCLFIQGIPRLSCVWTYCPHYNYSITESLWLEGTSGNLLFYPPYSERASYSTLPRTMCSCALNVSKDGDSISSLSNLFQYLTTLKVRKCFLMFRLTFFLICAHYLLSCHWISLATSSSLPLAIKYLYTLIRPP